MSSHEWIDHTAEVELAIEAGSPEDVFAEAVRAWAELQEASGDEASMPIALPRRDLPSLLADWLNAIVYEGERGFVATRVEDIRLGGDAIWAMLRGEQRFARPIVKAVTYHRLTFEEQNGHWKANVVLDV